MPMSVELSARSKNDPGFLTSVVFIIYCKNEYLVLALGEESAAQAVVGSINWTFRRLKKPRREMSASGYAFHSVYPQHFFVFPIINDKL